MKITKEQLTQIIKEEIAEVLNEAFQSNTRADRFMRAGFDPASYPRAEDPPTMPPQYLKPTSKEDLCSGWKAMFENPKTLDPGFSFRKADLNECEWLQEYDVEALRAKYPDPYAHIGKKVREDIKEQ
tara:strand:- start:107 stop:487 length:381 start_codon:yes stop_codon:yes gene_type:complete